MADQAASRSCTGGTFICGLIVGLVVGGIAGAVVPTFLSTGGSKGTPELEGGSVVPRDRLLTPAEPVTPPVPTEPVTPPIELPAPPPTGEPAPK